MGNANQFKVDRAGVIAFLRSAPVAGMLGEQAERVCARANAAADPQTDIDPGELYVSHVDSGRFTAVAKVAAAGKVAKWDNAKNNTLEKALG